MMNNFREAHGYEPIYSTVMPPDYIENHPFFDKLQEFVFSNKMHPIDHVLSNFGGITVE